MNRKGFLAVLVFLFLVSAGEWPVTAQSAEQEVRKAESDRFAAMLKGDLAALERLLAPELIYTHGDGRVVDKAAFIADLKTGDFKYVTIDAVEPKVRVFGDTAIVSGVAGMSVVNKGAPAKIRIVYSTTQLRRNGSWQMISWHATRLAQ